MRRVDPYLKVTIITKFLPKNVKAICGQWSSCFKLSDKFALSLTIQQFSPPSDIACELGILPIFVVGTSRQNTRVNVFEGKNGF